MKKNVTPESETKKRLSHGEVLVQEQQGIVLGLAKEYGLDFLLDLSQEPYVAQAKQMIPYVFARKHGILPVRHEGATLIVAISDPLNFDALTELGCLIKGEIREVLVPKSEIDVAIERCYHHRQGDAKEAIEVLRQQVENAPAIESVQGYDLLDQKEESPVIRLLNAMLAEAISQGASDIHFEPGDEGIGVRYRIDGVLQLRHAPPKEYQSHLITRIKVLAKLDIAEHRLPQDGRIKMNLGERQVDFRVSTVPTVHGERVVLRILDNRRMMLGLDTLGVPSDLLRQFEKLIRLSEGIVLVTGPTGSGKTTTLYSAISEINSADVNVMTIEDPVEFKLPGMAQIGVNPKINLTFAKGLRHILRQDPDVIMIGEIRDFETAEIAIQASLTGHLVLSTLHTNDAPSALTRLIDMGVEPYLLSSSVLGVLAQRLVRKICLNCKTPYEPDEWELKDLGIGREQLEGGKLYRGTGCEVCFKSGYKGRCGIYELMHVGDAIKNQLIKSGDATLFKRIAIEHGMKTLRQEGALLVIQGITTHAEVLRVTRGCEEA